MPSRRSDRELGSTVEVRRVCVEHLDWIHDLVDRGLTVRIRATGTSMYPFVLSGEWIWLRRIEAAPCIGDVVMVLERGHRPLVHRVARLAQRSGQTWIQTRGDASPRDDQWVPLSCVVGRVVRVEAFDASHARSTFRALVLGRLPRPVARIAGRARRAVGAWIRETPFALRS